jgi:putative pyruvate formate lyase activating enzyme
VPEASYLKLYREGILNDRVEMAVGSLGTCKLCPRSCGVNRLSEEKGFCRTGRKAKVASYNAHFGEESPLVGKFGSGTIFISSCNLLCSFCQNFEISHLNEGIEIEPTQMAAIMLELQERGCHNINFVTPTHVVPQILEALVRAIPLGLKVPLVYNCGGYERFETIRLLEGVFDIYMPDFKFWEKTWSERYCKAFDYREYACRAIEEMHSQVGDLLLDEEGIARRGLLVRHLVMPEGIAGTAQIMEFISSRISRSTYVNLMDQYRPCGSAVGDRLLGRRLNAGEYREAVDAAMNAGLTRLDRRDRPRIIFSL